VPRESKAARTRRAREIVRLLASEYPGSAVELCALDHRGPFQLLVATILSAQCTDERVNLVTPGLFARYPDPASLAAANPEELEAMIKTTGFFRSKAKSLIGAAAAIVERFPDEFPSEMADLTSLPGVGRKTANVIRSVGLGLPGLPVDTHVTRLTRRLGLTSNSDPVKIETEVSALVPETDWGAFSLRLILHGRRVCVARKPRCEACLLAGLCPSAGTFGAPPPAKRAPSRASRPR
jgi:endonuclease-3